MLLRLVLGEPNTEIFLGSTGFSYFFFFLNPSYFDAKLASASITAGDGNVLYPVDQETCLERGVCKLT